MLERAQVRFWAPVIAAAGFFPMLTFLMLSVWYIRLYFAPPIELAAAASIRVERVQVGAATVAPLAAVSEPIPAPQAARPPEPLTTSAIVADAHSANFHPARDTSSAEAPAMSSESALEPIMPMLVPLPPVLTPAEAPTPPPEHPAETMTEAGAPPPDETASEFASALPMFATFAVAPPMQFTIERPIPLPRPKPKVARVTRTEPLQPPRPMESSPRPISLD